MIPVYRNATITVGDVRITLTTDSNLEAAVKDVLQLLAQQAT